MEPFRRRNTVSRSECYMSEELVTRPDRTGQHRQEVQAYLTRLKQRP